jgi:hypothetical protein
LPELNILAGASALSRRLAEQKSAALVLRQLLESPPNKKTVTSGATKSVELNKKVSHGTQGKKNV